MVFRWRFMRTPIRFLLLLGLAAIAVPAVRSQEKPEAPPKPEPETPQAPAHPLPAAEISIRQGTLPNPVSDEVSLIYRRQLTRGKPDEPIELLPGMITVQHEEFGYAWDPVECRILFAWKGEAEPRDLQYVAEGAAPFAATLGAWGPPEFFGYRMVEGGPEFLYYFGRLGVEERIRPKPGGGGFVQQWKITQAEFGLQVTVPERWKDRVKASTGSWSGPVVTVPQSDSIEMSLNWTWPAQPDLPELAEAWVARNAPSPPVQEASQPESKDAPKSDKDE